MTPWLRRLVGPGRRRDAALTQPLDDTPAGAHTLGWLPDDALAKHMRADAHLRTRVIAYAAVAAVVVALALLRVYFGQ